MFFCSSCPFRTNRETAHERQASLFPQNMHEAVALLALAVVTSVHGEETPPLIVFGVDGLSARATAKSPGFQSILNASAYTLRARTTEHTESYEGWWAIFTGGWDKGMPHDRLFPHIRKYLPSAELWTLAASDFVYLSVDYTAADYHTSGLITPEDVVDEFERLLEDYTTLHKDRTAPDLSVVYTWLVDDTVSAERSCFCFCVILTPSSSGPRVRVGLDAIHGRSRTCSHTDQAREATRA